MMYLCSLTETIESSFELGSFVGVQGFHTELDTANFRSRSFFTALAHELTSFQIFHIFQDLFERCKDLVWCLVRPFDHFEVRFLLREKDFLAFFDFIDLLLSELRDFSKSEVRVDVNHTQDCNLQTWYDGILLWSPFLLLSFLLWRWFGKLDVMLCTFPEEREIGLLGIGSIAVDGVKLLDVGIQFT